MPTAYDNRRFYQDYCTGIADLCGKDPAARRALRDGRGRPPEEYRLNGRYLTRRTGGHPARRTLYTVAGLIAIADPLEALRNPPPPPAPAPSTEPPERAPHPAHQTTGADLAPAQAGTGPAGTGQTTNPDPFDIRQWRARPNLGVTLAHAVHRAGFHPDRTDDLLHVLLKVGEDQLHRRLPSLTARLLRAGLTPDWPVLLDDLVDYRFHPERVALRWQDGFYLTTTAPAFEDLP